MRRSISPTTETVWISLRASKRVAAFAEAYYRLHDYDEMIGLAAQDTRLVPADGDGWATLASIISAHRFPAAVAYARAIVIL